MYLRKSRSEMCELFFVQTTYARKSNLSIGLMEIGAPAILRGENEIYGRVKTNGGL